jgi:hypothetical protein
VLKLRLAVTANKNPPWHLSPQRGDSQNAGEHRAEIFVEEKISKRTPEKQSGALCSTELLLGLTVQC